MRIGIFGAGRMGQKRARAAASRSDVSLRFILDIDQAAARKIADEYGVSTAQEHVDLVIIATPPNSHFELARNALEHGQHVLVEKPLALSARDAEELRDLAHAKALVLRTGFHMRHYPAVKELKRLISAKTFGDDLFLRLSYGSRRPKGFNETWRIDPGVAGGGALFDQGIHALDLAQWLAPTPLEPTAASLSYGSFGKLIEGEANVELEGFGANARLNISWTRWRARFLVEARGNGRGAVIMGASSTTNYGPQSLTLDGTTTPYEDVNVWELELKDMFAEIAREPHVGDNGAAATILLERAYGLSRAI